MKTPHLIFVLCFIILVLVFFGYKDDFPEIKSSYISAYSPISPNLHALTHDGNFLTLDNFSQVNLKSGEINYPFASYLPKEWKDKYAFTNLQWSADGRYLAIGAIQVVPPELSYNQPVYILDMKSHSIDLLPDEVKSLYFRWSPIGKRLLIYPIFPASVFPQVYDFEKKAPILTSLDTINNFDQEILRGAERYLWSESLNMPVAQLTWGDPINAGGMRDNQQIKINTISIEENGTLNTNFLSSEKSFEFFPPDNVVDALFDPSGEYILVLQWKCLSDDVKQCTLYHESPYFDSIIDTSLILIHWSTGEQKELIRLSEVDSSNVIALGAEWSTDGRTILVWRKDVSPILFKLK